MSALEEKARTETAHTEPANTHRSQPSCLRYFKLILLDLDELFHDFFIYRDFTTGACVLYSLPLHLIHEITRSLDLRSQRNRFFSFTASGICRSQTIQIGKLWIGASTCLRRACVMPIVISEYCSLQTSPKTPGVR